ncbi:hypothetical protein L195_g007014 [Trifolium pratense]|uniref:Uncharacterized protein n=1 Tax=Trifolium pratense TaxID=57577 RepID=A0A2K3P574_TRIPR|nr:hypothetical protein L195_g007014 [Trifolium pratense]
MKKKWRQQVRFRRQAWAVLLERGREYSGGGCGGVKLVLEMTVWTVAGMRGWRRWGVVMEMRERRDLRMCDENEFETVLLKEE